MPGSSIPTASAAESFRPLLKTATVEAPVDAAFRRFTAEMSSWWPLGSHSVGRRESERVEMDGRVGGKIVERIRGGRECVWGTITVWDPPQRVAFTWHPGNSPEQSQDIEVRFTACGEQTLVELTHTGFERLGKMARQARRGYPLGWSYVLGRYAQNRGISAMLISSMTTVMMFLVRLRGNSDEKRS